ncbi:MAG TPA: hypothetical protein PKA53_12135 [Sphingobacterium sp.]|nr:hypothetical protein [Sphingobacterium sp.]
MEDCFRQIFSLSLARAFCPQAGQAPPFYSLVFAFYGTHAILEFPQKGDKNHEVLMDANENKN